MKFSSRTLVKVNFAIFSFIFFGCGGFADSNFIVESRPTSEKCDVLNDGGKIIKDLIEQIKEKNTNRISFISGKKTRKSFIPDFYIKNYEAKAKIYFSEKNFSLSEVFDQEFFNYAKQLYENKTPNILFKLVCCAINIYYIIDNDKSLTLEIKKNKLPEVYETFLKIVDYIIAKNLGLLELENKNSPVNGNSIPEVDPNYCLFKCKDLIDNLQQSKNNELYTCGTMVFPCGIFGNILEQFMSHTTDENGFDGDITVRKTFEILSPNTNGSEECKLITRSFDKHLNLNRLKEVYNHFIPLLPSNANLYKIVTQRSISWKELIDCLKTFDEEIENKTNKFISFSSVFNIKNIFSRDKIELQNPSGVFVKQFLNSDNEMYKYIISKDIVNNENFKKLNDALKLVFGISQKDILDIIDEFLQHKILYNSYDSPPITVCDNIGVFAEKVKEKRK